MSNNQVGFYTLAKRGISAHCSGMKAKAFIIILILVALGLGVGLIVLNQKATKDHQEAEDRIMTLSNNAVTMQASLDDVRGANRALETNLTVARVEFSNKLAAAETSLAAVTADLTKAKAEAKAAADVASSEIASRDKKITDLETQNQTLDKQSADLRLSITGLEGQISETQKKLTASDGDRQFLLKELQRLQTDKADLERKFNDLAVLKDQVKKLKEELSISRRLDWLRRGIYDSISQKGAEKLMHPAPTLTTAPTSKLNVEVKQDGEVKVNGQTTTAAGSTTNAPLPEAPAPTLTPK